MFDQIKVRALLNISAAVEGKMALKHALLGAVFSFILTACSTQGPIQQDGPPQQKIDPSTIKNATPKIEPRSRYGNPKDYQVNGSTYQLLASSDNYHETGLASWYGTKFHGRRTSSGEPYDLYKMTAAHKTLPIPCYAEVTNLENNKKAIVKINDRGPFHANRIIDLSYAAAVKLGFAEKGTAPVEVKVIQSSLAAPKPTAHAAHHYLQVGAFKNAKAASALAEKIKSSTQLPVQLSEISAKTSITRVRVGPLLTAKKIPQAKAKLAAIDIRDPLVIVE